jgi:Cu+-exporting ATPase
LSELVNQYRGFFPLVDFALAPPFFIRRGYYVSAYKSIKTKMLNIDIHCFGIVVMFEVCLIFDYGSGFFDSLTD